MMQNEDRKNAVVGSVVFAGNATYGVHLHCYARSPETRLAIGRIVHPVSIEPVPQHRAMLPLEQALENYMFLLVVRFAVDIRHPRRHALQQ
jgi:hypothetical protein